MKKIEVQDVELLKKKRVNEWVKLQKEFDHVIFRCKEKMDNAKSREEIQTAFVEGMNNLIDVLKE